VGGPPVRDGTLLVASVEMDARGFETVVPEVGLEASAVGEGLLDVDEASGGRGADVVGVLAVGVVVVGVLVTGAGAFATGAREARREGAAGFVGDGRAVALEGVVGFVAAGGGDVVFLSIVAAPAGLVAGAAEVPLARETTGGVAFAVPAPNLPELRICTRASGKYSDDIVERERTFFTNGVGGPFAPALLALSTLTDGLGLVSDSCG
jgi:hypothetical protein